MSISLIAQDTIYPVTIDFMDPIIQEPSGMAFIYNESNGQFEYWLHNDANNPDQIHALQLDNPLNVQRSVDINNPYIDWEDMAMDDDQNIYLGEFGNFVGANEYEVIKVEDPANYTGALPSKEIIPYEYPTPAIKDNEAMIHLNGMLYIFTKRVQPNLDPAVNDSITYVYKIPDAPLAGGLKHMATLHDQFQVLLPGDSLNRSRICGADISPDKSKVVLITYDRIWILSCFEGDQFFNGTIVSKRLPYRQYEAVSFINNHEIILTKEGAQNNPANEPKIFYLNLYPYLDGACYDCNKVRNGNMSEDNFAWTLFKYANADGNLTFNNGVAEVDITSLGTNQWHLNLRHKSLIAINNKTYKIRYTAWADDSRDISVILNKRDGSESYFYASETLSTVPTVYEYEFTMSSASDFNAYLSFNVGNGLIHKVYFDDIEFLESSCDCPDNRYIFSKMSNTSKYIQSSGNVYGYNEVENSNVTFDAEECVELNSGFEVKSNTNFEALTDGCD